MGAVNAGRISDVVRDMIEGLSPFSGLLACLYYMMPLENFQTVRKHGLVSRRAALEGKFFPRDYSDPVVQERRARKCEPIFHRCLHDYVPLYLNPRNPMLYSLRERAADLVVLGLTPALLDLHSQHVFADGNAASDRTVFSSNPAVLQSSLPALKAEYWHEVADGKRRRCAEVLVAPSIGPGFIEVAICSNNVTAEVVNDAGLNLDDRLIVAPGLFFAG